MANMRSKLNEIYSLEQLSRKNTFVHRLHPLSKIMVTVVYIVCIVTRGRYDLFAMAPFLFYPAITVALAEVPFQMIAKRTMIALPFTVFAGMSNLILDRHQYVILGNITITTGLVSLLTLLVRTFLCVSAVLILVSTTRFTDITRQFIKLHIPVFIVSLLEMIYRYIEVLLEEASTMIAAYRLRNSAYQWPKLSHMGPFVGHLFLRSMERSERVYQAMKCRGYGNGDMQYIKRKWAWKDTVFLIAGCVTSLVFAFL